MRHRWLLVWLVVLSVTAQAQWLNFSTPGTPRTKDGKPNLSAPTPRTAEGKPDLSGVWMHETTTIAEMRRLFGPIVDAEIKTSVPGMELDTVHKYAINVLADFKPEETPFTPEGGAAFKRILSQADPSRVCVEPPPFPLAGLLSEPIKIIQAPRMTVVLYEAGNMHRQIYADGRVLPKEVNYPAYLGYSTGRWERDVFVVETAGFNDRVPLDIIGHPHSEDLRITERFRRIDFGHMDMEVTFEDPKMYTKPIHDQGAAHAHGRCRHLRVVLRERKGSRPPRERQPASLSTDQLGTAAAPRPDSSRRARAVCRHQSRHPLVADRPPLRRIFESLLEAAVRVAAVPEAISYDDDDRLPEWGYGITNIVPRPTPGIDTLRAARSTSPAGCGCGGRSCGIGRRVVALVGVTVFRALFPDRRGPVTLGLQKERIGESAVFVLPNPSGRNANFSYQEMRRAFRALARFSQTDQGDRCLISAKSSRA